MPYYIIMGGGGFFHRGERERELAADLNGHHVEGEPAFVCWSHHFQDYVDDGQIVDSNLILFITDIGFHGNQSEPAQYVEEGGAKWSQFRGMKLCIAHAQ